ncbi:MAG TPA: hypothetical protein DCL60_13015 [Armatimonadetes bacterium]|nr:hypothetical protein [Armatimonadota bacterium]
MDPQKFTNPENLLRPAPFWAINDSITPEETARQMGDLIEKGFSGGFFHSRHGLTTDYMSEEWLQAMESALKVAKEKNGYLWLYDEDLWPSGNAGGQVAGMKDEYRAAMLEAEFIPSGAQPMPDGEDKPVAAYILIGRDGPAIKSAKKICLDEVSKHADSDRLIFRRHYDAKIGWWSGESYANLLNPKAVRRFINLTHEGYKKRFHGDFGGRIPGIFTDEPQIRMGHSAIPWWDGIPAIYAEWQKRNFWQDIPYLFFDGPEARKIRLLTHRTILRQFVLSFTKQIFDWCEANHLISTGHVNAEDTLRDQISYHCGGVMAHYRYMQMPGIDHLCRQIEGVNGHGLPMLLTVKQASSAARQLGRKHVLTEIFGVSRHTSTFEDFKWIGDFNLVLGANFFCPHLSLYSAKGRRKKDYPPNWNYQQTYWKDMRFLTDYFTRISQMLSSGAAMPDALILHPVESAAAGHRFGWSANMPGADRYSRMEPGRLIPADLPESDFAQADYLDRMFRRTVEAAMNAGYDCDLGDEGFLEDMGRVEDGRFVVGQMSYSAVVIPPASTWRPSTYALLKEFAEAGGRVIMLGKLPTELDCEADAHKWRHLAMLPGVSSIPSSARQLQDALDKAVPRTFSLRDTEGSPVPKTYVQHRIDGMQEIFFIANSDRNRSHNYEFILFGGADTPIAVWNPVDGSRERIEPLAADGDARYRFTLHPSGSLLLVTGQGAADGAASASRPADLSQGKVTPLGVNWNFCRSEENVLVMDRISASIDGGKTWWPEDMEWRVRRRLAEHFGTEESLQWQPWVAIRKGIMNGRGGDIILRYTFASAVNRPKSAYLVIEDIQKGRVSVNGTNIETVGAGWHWDRGFGKVKITNLVEKGINTIDFSVNFNFLTLVEPAYIVGDFGVCLQTPYKGVLSSEPEMLKNGSWQEQGYPFYSGRMIYSTEVDIPADEKKRFLRLLRPSGILYKIQVNGETAGNLLWRPWEVELTSFLKLGRNKLSIEVVSSRQNTLGPLHEREGDDNIWCGPNSFYEESVLRDELSLFDYGLLGGAELVVL